MKKPLTAVLFVLLLFAASIPAMGQGFARVGPVSFGGFPAWYQDKTGLVLDFCSPTTQSELDGGWCLLLPGDTGVPEHFTNGPFSDEHFYWAGGASAAMPNGGKALLVLGLEAAFAIGPVVQGDQMVFGRLRIVINPLPASGTYTVYTPFGKYVFPNQVQGEKLFFTEDIGIQCPPGDFACALDSKIGPFLLPSATPGGAEMAPLTAENPTPDTDPAHFGGAFAPTPYPGTGAMYIADPARIGPVTGSPKAPFVSEVDGVTYNHNIFRIEGPAGFVTQTFDFSLMGRVFTGALGGRVTVERASYARSATATKVDVFAKGLPSTQARIPAGPPPAEIKPNLQFFDAPCVANLDVDSNFLSWSAPSGSAHQMIGTGTTYWGQSAPADIPRSVCVMQTNAVNAQGQNVSAFFPTVLGDQVFITEAAYDPQTQRLVVKANSSDQVPTPTLTVTDYGTIDPATGQLVVEQLLSPPSKIRVTSGALGANEAQVTTAVGASGPGTTVPIAANDGVTIAEDSGAASITVLANDTIGGNPIPAGSIVTLAAQALRGTAVVNLDGTISYTPNPNANGVDSFTYTVSVNGIPSNVASVAVTVTPVNDTPVAINDSYNAIANVQTTLSVLANDVDIDGVGDIVGLANLTPGSAPAGAVWSVSDAGTAVSFTADRAGTYTFTYRARDAAGATSGVATATVTVSGAETITITLAEYRRSQGRLRITGTVSPVANPPQRLEVRWGNGSNTVSVIATPVADAAGAWVVEIRGATGVQNPDNSSATQVRVTGPGGGSATRAIAFR